MEKEAKAQEKKIKEITKLNNDVGNKKPAPKKKVDQDKKPKTEKLEDVIAKVSKKSHLPCAFKIKIKTTKT